MKCPFCREMQTEVYNSRSTKFQGQIWRRRRCVTCHESFTTYEAPDLGFLQVRKRGSRRPQPYSRAKLYASVHAALASAPDNGQEVVDAITDTIEAKVLDLRQRQVSSYEIARLVLLTLKHFNQPAFLRYLSYQTELARDPAFKKSLRA